MNSLLSTMMGGVTGPLLRAGLFPAAIFTTLLLLLVVPLVPESLRFFERLVSVSPQWEAAAMLLLTAVVAGLLYAMSTPIVRLYEGYPWQHGLLGRLLVSRYRSELRRIKNTLEAATHLRSQLAKGSSERAGVVSQISRLKLTLRYDFPDVERLVLPTRMGNTIRSAERYSSVEYGMDAIVLWPHLQSVMDAPYGKKLDDARYNLSFLLNTAFSLLLLAGVLVAIAVRSPDASFANTVLPAGALVVASALLYRGAIGAAKAWGFLVRGAFDLYRSKLIEKMGYGPLPGTRALERRHWRKITAQLLFGDKEQYPEEQAPAPSRAERKIVRPRLDPVPTDAPSARLVTTRGLQTTDAPNVLEVVITVRNEGEAATGDRPSVNDDVPDGFAYRADSARVDRGEVTVEGAGPYTFRLDRALLPKSDAVTLRYELLDLRPRPTTMIVAEPPPPTATPDGGYELDG